MLLATKELDTAGILKLYVRESVVALNKYTSETAEFTEYEIRILSENNSIFLVSSVNGYWLDDEYGGVNSDIISNLLLRITVDGVRFVGNEYGGYGKYADVKYILLLL